MTIHREWHSLVSAQLSSSPRPPPHHALNPLVRLNMLPLSLDVLSSLLFLLLADNGGLGHGGFSLAEISRRFSWLGPRWCPHAALSLRTLHWSERSRGPTLTVTRPGPVKSILSLLSPEQVTSTHSVRQMLCHSALRSSPQPSVSLFLITSPHRLLECIAKSLWKTGIRWNIYHSPSQSFVSGSLRTITIHSYVREFCKQSVHAH